MADDPKNTKAMEKPNAVPKPVQNQESKDIDFTSLSFDGLLTHIRFRDLEEVLEKIDIFLQSCEEELEFPGVYKACEEILVRIVKDVNVLKCPKLPSKCCYYAKRIVKAINAGASQRRFIVVCVYKSEKRDQCRGLRARYDNILVFKRIFYAQMPTSKPAKSSSSTQESRSSSVDSDTPRSSILQKNKFISHCLELILQFVKDNNQLNLEFTDLNLNDSEFLHNFFSSIVECNFDKELGGKNVFTSIREAVRIFSLKYDFIIKYVDFENGNQKKSLVLEKKPKSNKKPKTELPSTATKIPPHVKAKHMKNERKKAGLAKVVDDLSSEFLTHTLKKMLDFLSDETAIGVVFSTLDPVEKRFLKNISTCVNSHHMQYSLDHEVQRLVEQIQGLLKENVDYKLSKCVRKRGGFEKEVIYTKVPKFDGPLRLSRSWYPPSHESNVPGINQHSEWSTSQPLPTFHSELSKLLGYSPINFKPGRVNKHTKENASRLENERDVTLMAAVSHRTDYMEPILLQGDIWLQRMKEIRIREAQSAEIQIGESQRTDIQGEEAQNPEVQVGEPQILETVNEVQIVEIQNEEAQKAQNKNEEAQKAENKNEEAQKAENKSGEAEKAENKSGEAEKAENKSGEAEKAENKSGEAQNIPVQNTTSTKSSALKRTNAPIGYGAVAKRNVQLIEALSVPVQSEKAIRIMKSMGWKGGPLGSKENGIAEPIMPQLNRGTGAGLGHVKLKCPAINLPKAPTSSAPVGANRGSLLGPVPIDQLLYQMNMPITVVLPPVISLGYKPKNRTPSQFRQTIFTNLLILLKSNSDEIMINFNPPLSKRESKFAKYITNALALRQRVSLEAEHHEILDAITAEYKKNPGMVVTACAAINQREVVLKKVHNHTVLQPKNNRKQLRAMQQVELTEEAIGNIQELVDKHGDMWRNKRNDDKLVFKLEFYVAMWKFAKNKRETYLKVEFVNEIKPKQGQFLMTFFDNINKKKKFGGTPEVTLLLQIMKNMTNFQIVLGCCGNDFITASKKYICNKPATSSVKTINNNVIKSDSIENINSNGEEKQDYNYKFIKEIYYGDPTEKELVESDDKMITNSNNVTNDSKMPNNDENNAQSDVMSVEGDEKNIISYDLTVSDDKINVCDDKINVIDDKINVSDDKINLSDDKIDLSSKENNEASNEVTDLIKEDENSEKNDNITENSDYTSEYMIDDMSVTDYSAYTDYYSDDAEDITMDDEVIKICDDDDIIKISDDENTNVGDGTVKINEDIVKMSDDEVKIVDEELKMVDYAEKLVEEVKMVDYGVKMVEELEMIDYDEKIVEEVKMVHDGEKIIDEGEKIVEAGVKMIDEEVKIFEDSVKIVDYNIKSVDDNVNKVDEKLAMVDERKIRFDAGVKIVHEELKMIEDGVKMVDKVKMEAEEVMAKKRKIITDEGVVMVEDSAKKDNEVKMPKDSVKMIDELNIIVNDSIKMVANKAKIVDDRVKIVDYAANIVDEEATMVNDNGNIVDKAVKMADNEIKINNDTIQIKDETLKTGDDVAKFEDNEVNLDNGVLNIENDKIILAFDDNCVKTSEDNRKTGDDTEKGDGLITGDEEIETGDEGIEAHGIECDKMIDISLKSESLKAMLNIDVIEKQSAIEKSENDVKIVFLTKNYFLVKDMPNYIQGLISLNIMHTKELPLLKCHGVQDGALVYSCQTRKSYDWLNTVCVANNININTKEFDKMRLKIETFFKFDDEYFFNMLEMYNREISTKDWVILMKQVLDNYVIFDIKMDAKSFKFILDSNMELYAGIDKVTFSIIYV